MSDGLTLDQLRVFVAVVDEGSFSAAAQRLRRAQSAVSHAIASLESQLGLTLFDRSSKRVRLTMAGEQILSDVRSTLARVERLKARASGLDTLEPELSLAVSVIIPQAVLVRGLGALAAQFPLLGLRLHVEELGGVLDLVIGGKCRLGLTGATELALCADEGLERRSVGSVDVIAVASKEHPLASIGRPLAIADLEEHRQLVPTSRVWLPYPNALATDVWQIADLNTRRAMLLAGQGWGTIPAHLVQDDLASGRLVRLDLGPRPDEAMKIPLFFVFKAQTPPGPAGEWFIERMSAALE